MEGAMAALGTPRWLAMAGAALASALLVAPPTSAEGPESARAPAPAAVPGVELLEEDLTRVAAIASELDRTVAETEELLADESVMVSSTDGVYFQDRGRRIVEPSAEPQAGPFPDADTFLLNSKPGSLRTIYLDFTGHTISGTEWPADDDGPYTSVPYDFDGSPSIFGPEERDVIQFTWQRVAEDFAPFDVNVTTQDPGFAKINRTNAADQEFGTRVVITDSPPGPIALRDDIGGLAYLDAFDQHGAIPHAQRQPAWVFATNVGDSGKLLAEAVSHEAGHNLGLEHDGQGFQEYYEGHGVWAPIMGLSYDRPVTQWSRGEYANPTNTEDDFAEMASHGAALRADDHTNSFGTATFLTETQEGIITSADDADLFQYTAATSGTVTFAATPAARGANLDVSLRLYATGGALLAEANPPAGTVSGSIASGLDASIVHPVTAGSTYFLQVAGGAHLTPTNGFSRYGSVGAYTASVSGDPVCVGLDGLEPNDTTSTASVAASGTTIASRTCAGDDDHVGIEAVAGQQITASLEFAHADGNLDLALVKPSGGVVATSASTTDDEAVTHTATETGIYVARVFSPPSASVTYDLTLTSATCPPDDALEPNDSFALARSITSGSTVRGIACPADPDVFSIPASVGQRIDVRVDFAHRFGNLDLRLLDPTGAQVAIAQSTTDDEAISHVALKAGSYRIQVDGIAGAANTYALTATVATPQAAPGAPTGVVATAGNGRASLQWVAPAISGGGPITSYVITPSIGEAVQAPISVTGPATTAELSGLNANTLYTFRVAAVNAFGTGAPSAPSAAVLVKAGYAPFASWSALVTRQYLDLTTLPPTSAELSLWTSALANGSVTKGDLIEAIRRGTDNTVNVDPAARLYRAFLGRAPDPSGLRFWIGRRRAGTWTLNRIADSFAGSSEFRRKYGDLTNRQFVTLIYTDVLARPADQAGVDYWTRQLDLRRRNRGSVMVGFSESSEYKRKQAENTDVAIAHLYLLGRTPTAPETAAWVDRQRSGTPQAVLARELLDSSAYATRITG
jgi:hypothetical protein